MATLSRYFSQTRETPAHLVWPRLLLIVSSLALLLLGLIMVYSAGSIEGISQGLGSTYYLGRQALVAVLGLAGAFALWKLVPFQLWKTRVVFIVWAIAVALLVMTALVGYAALGATRWIQIGGFRFQPSEFAKIAVALMAARIIDRYRNGELDKKALLAEVLVFLGVPVGIILGFQSDLGTTVVIGVAILAVMWLGEVETRYVAIFVLVAIVLCVIAVVGSSYRSDRWIYLDPWNDGQNGGGAGYQIIHSFYAFAEGGLFGVGIGNSAEKFLYLPEAENDFIFSVIGEELGLVGALIVILLFIAFLWAGLRIAQSAATPQSAMVAGSMTIMIVFQAFLNIGCVIGVLPTTGKPLPFISYGGSSLLATLLMVGFILSVSDEAAGTNLFDRRNRDNFRVVKGER